MDTDTLSSGDHIQVSPKEQQDGLDRQLTDDHSHQEDELHKQQQQQKTLALIKPDAMQANYQQAIIDKIQSSGFTILQQKQIQFSLDQACLFYREHEGKSFYPQLTEWISSAPIYAMILEKENAIQDWRSLMGPTDATKAREIDPTSIRALFGTDGSHNATHGSDCLTSAEREMDIVFGSLNQPSVTHTSPQHDLSTTAATATTNTSGGDDDGEEPFPSVPPGDNSNTSAPIPPADAEHPVNTPDLLSHSALVHAPTGSFSDSVKPSSDDEGALETATDTDNRPNEDTADMQDPSQPSTNGEDDINETQPANSIGDETSEHHKTQIVSEQQHQDNLVTETTTVQELDDHLTSDSCLSLQPASTPQDQTKDIHDAPSSASDTAQTNLNDDGDTKESATKESVPEVDSLLANEQKVIDGGAHDGDATLTLDAVDNKQETPVMLEASLAIKDTEDQQERDNKPVDDEAKHDMTPEQETESLAINETTIDHIAKPDNVESEHDHNQHSMDSSSCTNDKSLVEHVEDAHEPPASSVAVCDAKVDDNTETASDDDLKAHSPTKQDDDGQHGVNADDTFDSISLANDSEIVDNEVPIDPVMATATVEVVPVKDSVNQVSEPATQIPESAVAAAVAVMAEETVGPICEPTALVLESEPTISAEAIPVAAAADHDDVPEKEEPLPVDVMPVKPDSVEEPVAGDNLIDSGEMENQLTVETPNSASPMVAVTDDTKPAEEDHKPIVTEVAIVDDDKVEDDNVASNNDQSTVEDSGKEQAESHAIHEESALTTDHSKPLNDEDTVSSHEEHHDDNGTEATSATEEDLTTIEDTNEVVADREPSTSDQGSTSTDNDGSTVTETREDQPKSVPGSDEETDQVKTSSSSDQPKDKEGVPANKPTSPTRSPTRKSPTTGLKAPTKIGTTRKVPSTTTAGATTKSNNTTAAPATTRLRRPGTAAASGSATTAGAEKPVKKATGLKSSASPGRTPLPRVATLAKKPDSATPTETKPTVGTTKKRSSVINRLTAPTTASANKRASDAASSTAPTTKAASANGSAHRVKTATGTAPPATTRRTATKPATSTVEKPVARRTSPSSTAEKPTTTRRTSPPTSTTPHGTTKTARTATTSSATSRISSSSTAASDSMSGTATAKRSPVRRISPPSSTHPSTATKPSTRPTTKTSTTPSDKKGDPKRKVVATKASGTKATAAKKDSTKDISNDDAPSKPDIKDHNDSNNDAPSEPINEVPSEPANDAADHQTETAEEPLIEKSSAPEQEQEEQVLQAEATPEIKTEEETATLAPAETNSASRPKTPELAQLRNKFETLQTNAVAPTRSSNNKPASTPHNIKDLISRFN